MNLLSLIVKHERRIRLVFSNACAGGAFVASLYTVTSLENNNVSPNVVAALIVPSNPSTVELVLDNDLVNGAMYRVDAPNVPAVDASLTPVGTAEKFRFGSPSHKHHVEPGLRDLDRLRFFADLIWTGDDYQEEPNGDLARVEGKANVTKALWHALSTNGLPWNDDWGVDAREYVDSPSAAAAPLRGVVGVQAARDPRVKSVKTTVSVDGTNTFVTVTPTLIDGETGDPVSIAVPNDS